ncbi:MAG: hypothetical protein ACRDL2_04150 [Gaiellaceae bacterium]
MTMTEERSQTTVSPLTLTERRAVGGAVSRSVLSAYFGVALAGWVAAAATSIAAASDLAAGRVLAEAPLLAVHLLALGVLPFAVAGGCFHLLPVMLRNDLPSQRALWLALPLLCGGFPLAVGLASDRDRLLWIGAGLESTGLVIVLAEILKLVVFAPRGRMLVASRVGVALSCFHVTAALVLGSLVFDGRLDGASFLRWLLIHLHVALLGWIALLIVSVGRTLGPMLAVAPVAPPRGWPLEELTLTAGLWMALAGIGLGSRTLMLVGAAGIVLALGRFALLMLRTARLRRAPIEAPLAHLLAGALLLVQAAAAGIVAAAGVGGTRLVTAYVVLLLVGWAGGVVVGHVGKLLALSIWVWWPPGPRPKQAALHSRRLGVAEAAVFALGVEALALGALLGSAPLARAGSVAFCVSTVMTAAGAATTWRRRARPA